MSTLGEVFIKHPSYDVSAGLRVSYEPDPAEHGGNYVSTATLNVETGACIVQFYATAETLRAMAALLNKAAETVDEGVFAAAAMGPVAESA